MENCREEVVLSKPLLLLPSFKEEQERKCLGNAFSSNLNTRERKLVCVTSGNSYLGSHIVKELLAAGYLIRLTIQKEGAKLKYLYIHQPYKSLDFSFFFFFF